MRFGLVFLSIMVALVPTHQADAHAADEFAQVTVQVAINDERVSVLSRMPARYVSLKVFEGETPVDLDRIEPEELATKLLPVLAERCPLKIDGVVVPPTIVRAEMRMTGSRLPVRSFSMRQALDRGYLIFMASYDTKGKPRRVDMQWTLIANDYDERDEAIYPEEEISLAAITRGYGKESFSIITPMEPGLTWHSDEAFALPADLLVPSRIQRNVLRIPVLSIGLWFAGAVFAVVLLRRSWGRGAITFASAAVVGLLVLPFGQVEMEHTASVNPPSDDEALAIFESLHRNIYRAFDYTQESAVYDALAESIDGPMLETIYNDVYQSLIMREENGAVSKVVRVEIDEAKLLPIEDGPSSQGTQAYRVHCDWQVDGVVTHFGHSHARTNAFEAVYTVAPRASGWRIVDAEILQQRRLDDGTQTPSDLANDL